MGVPSAAYSIRSLYRRPNPPRKYDPPATTNANSVEMMAPCLTAGPLLIA